MMFTVSGKGQETKKGEPQWLPLFFNTLSVQLVARNP